MTYRAVPSVTVTFSDTRSTPARNDGVCGGAAGGAACGCGPAAAVAALASAAAAMRAPMQPGTASASDDATQRRDTSQARQSLRVPVGLFDQRAARRQPRLGGGTVTRSGGISDCGRA